MNDYFKLHYVRINRKIKEAGLNPLLGYLLVFTAFVLLSEYIFHKTEFAKYLIILTCLSLQFKFSSKQRTDFLNSTFGDKLKIKIRIFENLILCIPFVSILVYKCFFIESIILFFTSISLAFLTFRSNFNVTIPTPFSKSPFEFPRGFRRTIYIFPVAYVLAFIAINIHNLNLGIFSILLIFLITLSFFAQPEDEYYVWVHKDTPKSFLKKKIITATKGSLLLTFPIIIGLLLYYPIEYDIILLTVLIGNLYLWLMILAKYSVFPSEINLPEGIFIALAVFFIPLTLFLIPYFYTKSINNLRLLLDD